MDKSRGMPGWFLVIYVIWFLGIGAIAQGYRNKNKDGSMTAFYKTECSANSRYANISCSMTKINATATYLSVNYTFFEEENVLRFRWKQYQKTTNNRYIPGFFDITFDLCEMFKNFDNLPKSHPLIVYGEYYNPRLLENVKRYGHTCPYVGLNSFALVTVARRLDGPLKLIPAADYRADFTMLNGKHNLVTLKLYSSTM